jgi:hypothetical protein
MKMKFHDMFPAGGRGIIASSDSSGNVNIAVYAKPHIVDDKTVAWGMTEGRTWKYLKENPNAAYLYMNPGQGYSGVRLKLSLKEFHESGDMLEKVKKHTAEIVSAAAAEAVKHVAYFEVEEIRPLI